MRGGVERPVSHIPAKYQVFGASLSGPKRTEDGVLDQNVVGAVNEACAGQFPRREVQGQDRDIRTTTIPISL